MQLNGKLGARGTRPSEINDFCRICIHNIAMCFDNTLAPWANGNIRGQFETRRHHRSWNHRFDRCVLPETQWHSVTVYEASGRSGGVIQSIRKDGYLAEFRPKHHPRNVAENRPIRPRHRIGITSA